MKNAVQQLLDIDARSQMAVTFVSDDPERVRVVRHSLSPLGFPELKVIPYSIAAVEVQLKAPVILLFDGDNEHLTGSELYSLVYGILHSCPNLILIAVSANPDARKLFSLLTLGSHAVFLHPFLPEGLEDLFKLIQRGVPFGQELLSDVNRNRQLSVLVREELERLHDELAYGGSGTGIVEREETRRHLERVLKMAKSFTNYYSNETKQLIKEIYEINFKAGS